jgi:DNA-binding LacI/PurR family transcriptional regulator
VTTIADVARRAGVTAATVSNVITQRVPVSPKTRARVLKAIEELDYRPNLVARGLARGKTLTLALMVPTLTNPYFAEVVEEVERVMDQHDFQMLLSMTRNHADEGRRHLRRMASRRVDGFIIMGMAADTGDVVTLTQQGHPVVVCMWNHHDLRVQHIPVVDIDFRLAGELGTRHLLECGHRRIATIVEEPVQHSRLQGYQMALLEAGIVPDPIYIRPGDSSFASGYQAALDLLALPTRPTAIFACNDWMALGAMEAVERHGLSIPADMAIVGVDDIAQAAYAHPPLTTVSTPRREVARAATELLLRLIDHSEQESYMTLVRPHLIVRQSTISPSFTNGA